MQNIADSLSFAGLLFIVFAAIMFILVVLLDIKMMMILMMIMMMMVFGSCYVLSLTYFHKCHLMKAFIFTP